MTTLNGRSLSRPLAQAVRRPRYSSSFTEAERDAYNEQQRLYRLSRKSSYVPPDYLDDHTAAQIEAVLSGVEIGKVSPRGFVKWTPDAESQKLLAEIKQALDLYRDHLPLTARQVYYVLLDKYHHDKGTTFENALYYVLERGRRGGQIKMKMIRDDSGTKEETIFWDGAEEWLSTRRYQAAQARLDRQEGQKRRRIVYCEAVGMVPQLVRVADPYGIPVMSSGGYDSIPEKHALAEENTDTEVLHIGDLDPHGDRVFVALAEDISAFAHSYGNHVSFTRLAVTPKLVTRLRLPTSPYVPKRNKDGAITSPAYPHDYTCQAEAIPPDQLARIVREAITDKDRFDEKAYDKVLRREKALHTELAKILRN